MVTSTDRGDPVRLQPGTQHPHGMSEDCRTNHHDIQVRGYTEHATTTPCSTCSTAYATTASTPVRSEASCWTSAAPPQLDPRTTARTCIVPAGPALATQLR